MSGPVDNYSDRYEDSPHIVYRMLDENGVPLYIGCTVNLEQRLNEHRGWLAHDLTATVTTESHPTRSAALAAEREAIRAECPVFNTEHNSTAVNVAKSMYAEEYGYHPPNARWSRTPSDLRFWDIFRRRHDELVHRVRTLRGETPGIITLKGGDVTAGRPNLPAPNPAKVEPERSPQNSPDADGTAARGMRAWARPHECAKILGVHVDTFSNWVERFDLRSNVRHHKHGPRETRWSPESLWRWHLLREPSLDLAECVAFCEQFPLPTEDTSPELVVSR
jgi:predicted GIY-YIG superfamily endonuclease